MNGDTIFEQTTTDYDAAGNVIKTTSYARKHTSSATGELDSTSARMNFSNEANATLADVRQIMRNERGDVVRLAESVERAASQAREVLNKTGKLVSAMDVVAIDRLIQELSRAAVSIRVFADYLDRHPEALIRGKNP